jgi:hypothetical protein
VNYKLLIYFCLFSFIVLFFLYNLTILIILLLFIIGVISMMHMRVFTWFGAIDMNTIVTVYATINYGLPAGIFVANASVIGNIIIGEVDLLPYDFCVGILIVAIANMFTMQSFVLAVVVCATVFFLIGFVYLYCIGMLEWTNIVWLSTNYVWILFIMLKVYPLLFHG